jgi:Family of unknown function (DUF6459)
MTSAHETRSLPQRPHVRRPPSPEGRWASVTNLSQAGSRPGGLEQVPLAAIQGTLALDLSSATRAPLTPELRIVDQGISPSERELRVWAARFAQAVVEVLGGDRPLTQLLRWTNARVYRDLERRVRILGRASPAPLRLRTIRPQVRSVHICQPAPDCAEVSVHVRYGQRSRAIAARLEHRGGRWSCTALQLG